MILVQKKIDPPPYTKIFWETRAAKGTWSKKKGDLPRALAPLGPL